MGTSMMRHKRAAITVLGAGLTGVATALELAKQGAQVTLVEQDARGMNRASLRNEGKIHLGFIYANDRTLATARLQLEGALSFRSLLHRWIGPRADTLPLSSPFVYLVARDSLLTMDQLEEHYAAVESIYREHLRRDPRVDYLGRRPTRLYERCLPGELPWPFHMDHFIGGFQTQELAIDPRALAHAMREANRRKRVHRLPPRAQGSVYGARGRSPAYRGNESGWNMAHRYRPGRERPVGEPDRFRSNGRNELRDRLGASAQEPGHSANPGQAARRTIRNDGHWTLRRRSGAGRPDCLSVLVPRRSARVDA